MKKVIKKSIFTFAIAILIGIMCSENTWAYEIVIDKEVELFQHTRQLIFHFASAVMTGGFILALFRKVSWWNLLGFFMWVLTFTMFGLTIDYLTEGDETVWDVKSILNVILIFVILSIPCLLPILISLIRYKFRKIDKKVFKHHLFIWLMSGLMIMVISAVFAGTLLLLGH